MISVAELQGLSRHSYLNKKEIEKSAKVGCYYCQKIFPATEVAFLSEGTGTCLNCGTDSLIADCCTLLTPLLLMELHGLWFSPDFAFEEVEW